MSTASASNELWSIFDARRVKAPELKGLDVVANGMIGWVKNRRRALAGYKRQVERIEALEKEIHELGATRFAEEVQKCRDLARLNRLEGAALERGMALVREGALRAVQDPCRRQHTTRRWRQPTWARARSRPIIR